MSYPSLKNYIDYKNKYFTKKKDNLKFDNTCKISIFTIVKNAERTIEKTIQSVIYQDYTNFEYIIVDGNSTDNTCEIIKSYDDNITLWTSENDLGTGDAVNKAISISSGDIIFGLSADDWMETGVLKVISEKFKQFPNCGFFYGDMVMVYNNEKKLIKGKENYIAELSRGNPEFNYPCIAYNMKCFEEIGLFDLNYKFNNDFELLLRLYSNGYNGIYVPEIVINRLPGGIGENNHFQSAIDKIAIIKKYDIPVIIPSIKILYNLIKINLMKVYKGLKNLINYRYNE